jgi:hypothetical protein
MLPIHLNHLGRRSFCLINNLITRSNHTVQLKELVLNEYGNEVNKCLSLDRKDLNFSPSDNKGQLLVKLVAAPINPADLNIIQGSLT